jgi:hypothetical protein
MEGPLSALPAPERDSGATRNIPSLHSLDETSLTFIINHVFLHPKLPSKSDCTPEHEASLLRVFKDLAETFTGDLKPQSHSRRAWGVITQMLASTTLLHDRGTVENDLLEEHIASMNVGGEHVASLP